MNPIQIIAEVISIGDEMTSGSRVDTNAAWLSRRLSDLGIHVAFHTTVGDTLSHNIEVFRAAVARADVIVATGGLGPTQDDLTRESLAIVANQPLEFRQAAMDHIAALFARHDFQMPERNRVQAMFPAGSGEIPNLQGTAPGIDLQVLREGRSSSRIFALPGVPAEMTRMFDDTVAPRIVEQFRSGNVIRQHVMKLFGIGESEMERRLGDMISRERQPRVGITVSAATISLRITAMANSEQVCQTLIEQTRTEILQKVPEYHFGDGEDFEQHQTIDDLLVNRNESLVIVELGRAALLGNLFASLGAGSCLAGSLGFPDAETMCKRLDVDSVDDAVRRIKANYAADWLILIDHYPAITTELADRRPKHTIEMTFARPDGEWIKSERVVASHPDIVHWIVAKATMARFRRMLGETQIDS